MKNIFIITNYYPRCHPTKNFQEVHYDYVLFLFFNDMIGYVLSIRYVTPEEIENGSSPRKTWTLGKSTIYREVIERFQVCVYFGCV